MIDSTAFIYKDDYLNYQFGLGHPFKPIREKYTLDKVRQLGIFNLNAELYEPSPASEEDLLLVHSKEFVDYVKKMSELGEGYLDCGDTPATKGIYEAACSVVGGSICGADLIMEGKVSHAFNPGGGLHHAKRESAAGFCVFNDIAITARHLKKKYGVEKIAIVDVDGHHGDGTQEILYDEPILKISLHHFGIFPGTGDIDELGSGKGKGYSVNIPLPEGTYDEPYLYAFDEVVVPLIEAYEPEILLNQFGVDGHYQDPLVGLNLTTNAYLEISAKMHELAHKIPGGKYLIFGGGGYKPSNVSRCWAIMFATISGFPRNKLEELFDRDQPKKDEQVFDIVKQTVDRVKKTIFPFHGLKTV